MMYRTPEQLAGLRAEAISRSEVAGKEWAAAFFRDSGRAPTGEECNVAKIRAIGSINVALNTDFDVRVDQTHRDCRNAFQRGVDGTEPGSSRDRPSML